jgi:hypothetical protein
MKRRHSAGGRTTWSDSTPKEDQLDQMNVARRDYVITNWCRICSALSGGGGRGLRTRKRWGTAFGDLEMNAEIIKSRAVMFGEAKGASGGLRENAK